MLGWIVMVLAVHNEKLESPDQPSTLATNRDLGRE